MANDEFRRLLRQLQASDLLRYNTKQNHAPMVLIAMYRMGASDEQLRSYFSKLEIATGHSDETPLLAVEPSSWKRYLGRVDALDSYTRFFHSETRRHGSEATLRRYLPALLGGVTAHAFHPLLRLAYGIDLHDPTEIALALAYWAATYLPGPEMPAERSEATAVDLLKKLAGASSLRKMKPQSRSIAYRIQQFYKHPDFQSMLRPIPLDAKDPLQTVSLAIAEAFAENHHFTMLHAVTGCLALRCVLPYSENPQKTISEYWYAICAAYLSVINLPGHTRRALPEGSLDWRTLRNQALATGVDHTIKLTYACLREWEHYQRDIYPRLARRDIADPAPFA